MIFQKDKCKQAVLYKEERDAKNDKIYPKIKGSYFTDITLFSADYNYWFSLKYYIFMFNKVTAKYKPYAVLNS